MEWLGLVAIKFQSIFGVCWWCGVIGLPVYLCQIPGHDGDDGDARYDAMCRGADDLIYHLRPEKPPNLYH